MIFTQPTSLLSKTVTISPFCNVPIIEVSVPFPLRTFNTSALTVAVVVSLGVSGVVGSDGVSAPVKYSLAT